VTEAISNLTLPQVYIGGGDKKGNQSILANFLGAEFAKK